jgi:hypothetical protein
VDFLVTWPWLAEPDSGVASTIQDSRSNFEGAGFESRLARTMRHAESAVGLRYARKTRAYPGFWQFYRHEVLRPLSLAVAKMRGLRLGNETERGPRVLFGP